jgi:tRNA 2-thiocytidine biosynthesis protein TtcA
VIALKSMVRKQMVAAMDRFGLIEAHDRVLVAVSGGKDSAIMYELLCDIQKRAPFAFELQPLILDQKQPGFDVKDFKTWIETFGTSLIVLEEDTYSIVKEKTQPGKSYCGLCSRLRRGILYNYAFEHGYTKIALGHHRDDLNETLLMNMFFNGQIASMPAKLLSDDKRNTVIRPMVYVKESDIVILSQDIPIIPCRLCGSQEGMQRARIKSLIENLSKDIPHIASSLLNAQENTRFSQLLAADEKNYDKGTSKVTKSHANTKPSELDPRRQAHNQLE